MRIDEIVKDKEVKELVKILKKHIMFSKIGKNMIFFYLQKSHNLTIEYFDMGDIVRFALHRHGYFCHYLGLNDMRVFIRRLKI